MPVNSTVTITDDGTQDFTSSESFGEITFAAAGTYVYTLKEKAQTAYGYTFDTAERIVTVTVVDEEGVLKASYAVTVDGEEQDSAAFVNNYEPDPTSVSFPIEKIITGNDRPGESEAEFLI